MKCFSSQAETSQTYNSIVAAVVALVHLRSVIIVVSVVILVASVLSSYPFVLLPVIMIVVAVALLNVGVLL